MTARKYLKRIGGFTLVELLIVIAILAIIALIVIAAINPIEQANRARDTGMKADGSQLVSAIDRYFTARFEFLCKISNLWYDDIWFYECG
jgi:prepilin-type N-terminal cleavage/methylation domain-containing protein